MQIDDCFECGGINTMVLKVRPTWDIKWGQTPLTVKDVELWECSECPEGGVFTGDQSRAVDRKVQEALAQIKKELEATENG